MASEFKIKNGLIVVGDVSTSGTITINGALAATQSWVTSQAYLTSASLSGYATQSYVTSAISSLIDAAPAALDTLNELAAALGDDANFSTTITNSIAGKLPLAGGTLTGGLSGTSATFSNNVSVLGLTVNSVSTFSSLATFNGNISLGGNSTLYSNGAVTLGGALTGTSATFSSNVTLGNNADLVFVDLAGTFPTTGKGFDWTLNNDGARIYAIQPNSDSIDFVFQLRDNATTNDRFVFWVDEWQGPAYDKYPLIISGGTEFDLKDSSLYTNTVLRLSNSGVLQNVTGNISMFTNNAGYLTSYTETDTLATVTGRGATTSTNISVNNAKIGTDGTYGGGYSTIGFGGTTNGYNRVFGQVGTSDGLFLASATGRGIYFRVNGGSTDNVTINSSGNVAINTANFTYANGDNASVISGVVPTANKLFIDGSIQLLNNTDAIVIGRGASTFLTDEELGFGWGSGWYMIDGSYLRVRNNISVYSTGSFYGNIFYDVNDANYYGDFAGTSRFNNLYIEGGVASVYNASGYSSAAIEVRERNFAGAQDDTWSTAPRIGFHWGGRVASQIALASNGRIHILNDPGTANEAFQAAIIYSSGYGDSTQWNTAYSWGNHASYSYATTSYVTTQINNLIAGAPGALDTLDELAAALGDDSNFATTVTNSIAGKVSKAGDTMTSSGQQVLNIFHGAATGDFNDALFVKNTVSAQQVQIGMATTGSDGDHHRVSLRAYKGAQALEGVFGIALRQPGSAAHTQRLTLDYLGNLTIGGALTESSSIKLKENIETSEGNLEKVVNLRPVTYNKIGSQTTELGLIAEEVAEVYPEFVQYDENGEPIGVNYSRLTAALIGAVKELTNQVQELNKKING